MTNPDEYVNLRTDIAELRGVVTGNLQALQAGQQRHEEKLNRVDVEFDQVHARYNRLEASQATQGETIKSLASRQIDTQKAIKERDGTSRANWSLVVAGAGVVLALASKITWV